MANIGWTKGMMEDAERFGLWFEIHVSVETLAQMCKNHDFPERNMRFNARFKTVERAREEQRWYRKHDYVCEIHCDGEDIDGDGYDGDGALEWPDMGGG